MRVAYLWCGVLAIALGGCSRDPYVTSDGDAISGNWRIARQTDRITGSPLASVAIVAMASNTYEDFPKPSMMQLTCFDGKPLARFSFEFKIGSDVNTMLGYRFDDKPGRDSVPGVRFLQKHDTVVIEDPADVSQFVKDMDGSRSLYVRIRSITHGRTTIEYNLDGSGPALRAAFADCPVMPAVVAPVAPSKKRVS